MKSLNHLDSIPHIPAIDVAENLFGKLLFALQLLKARMNCSDSINQQVEFLKQEAWQFDEKPEIQQETRIPVWPNRTWPSQIIHRRSTIVLWLSEQSSIMQQLQSIHSNLHACRLRVCLLPCDPVKTALCFWRKDGYSRKQTSDVDTETHQTGRAADVG